MHELKKRLRLGACSGDDPLTPSLLAPKSRQPQRCYASLEARKAPQGDALVPLNGASSHQERFCRTWMTFEP